MNFAYLIIVFALLVFVGYDAAAFTLGDFHWINQVWDWSPQDRFAIVLTLAVMAALSWFVVAGL